MAVVLRQSATASGDPATATWPLGAPLQGSLLVGVQFDRIGAGAGCTVTFPAGWTTHVHRVTLSGDIDSRRRLAVATTVAGAAEPTTVEVSDTCAVNRLTICELEPTAGETFTFLEAASNDNGAINNASTIATGTTADTGSGSRLVIGAFGGRIGPSSPLLQGTSAWTNSLGGIVNHAGGSNDRVTSFAFAVHGTGGTKSATASTDPDPNENTGLSAAILAFGLGVGPTVDIEHGLVMSHSAAVNSGIAEVTVDVAHGLIMGHSAQISTIPAGPPPSIRPRLIPPSYPAPQITWQADGRPARTLASGDEAGILANIIGLDLPPDGQYEVEMPVTDGSQLVHRRRLPRELIFPVVVHTVGDLTEFERRRRSLMIDLDPARPGRFTWGLPDGTSRSLRCRVSEVDNETGHRGGGRRVNFGRWRVVMRALDPYWFSQEQSVSFTAPAGVDFYGGATAGAPPYEISESTVLGTAELTVVSDANVWPIWEIHGPTTSVMLHSVTLDLTLDLTATLTLGETLIVRTDPRTLAADRFTIDGVNVWATVAGQFPEPWPLIPGPQTLDVTAQGTTSDTKIILRYTPRFLTA